MASIARQPFAPLTESRLHALTSLKNRQNGASSPSPIKRKASDAPGLDDSENVDPILFSKRVKGANGLKDSCMKPPAFILTKSASTNDLPIASPLRAARSILNPKSPVARLNTSIARSSPLSAPAGRSPTRGKRSGLLNTRRRTGGSFTRVDPPAFPISSGGSSIAPFSLDAALKGTIPSYTSRSDASSSKTSSGLLDIGALHEPEMKSSWFFEIHEDTPEQEMTNLLQHSTCVLDISSDEENESRRERERAEGKENVPPVGDISQTSRPRATRRAANPDEMMIEKERSPLGEMNPAAYYSEGCDENSIVIVPGDDDEVPTSNSNENQFAPELSSSDAVENNDPIEPEAQSVFVSEDEAPRSVEELMEKTTEPAPGAAVLEPIEGTGEYFEVWESSSAKDEAELAAEC